MSSFLYSTMASEEKFIEEMFEKGILVNKELLNKEVDQNLLSKVQAEGDIIVLNEDYINVLKGQTTLVDWYEIDRYRVEAEKERDEDLYQSQLQQLGHSNLTLQSHNLQQSQELTSLETKIELDIPTNSLTTTSSSLVAPEAHNLELHVKAGSKINEPSFEITGITLVINYENKPHKFNVKDFTNVFITRYRFIENILRHRQELQNNLAINRLEKKKEKEAISIIGIILDIGVTKNGNLILKMEDLTGSISVIVSKNKTELFSLAKDLVLDEIVGIVGVCHEKVIFADQVVWPDLPEINEIKKGPEEEFVIFLSDIHVGSKKFLKEEFDKFLQWINGKVGNDQQKEIAHKVKYIIIAGDTVDGVGIYPSQEEELEIKDVKEQYIEFARLIKQIPLNKQIIICPGNHDATHLAEPQPPFYKDYAAEMFTLPNVTLVSNPAMVNIGKKDNFSGFDVLLYHGYSFDYYVANVESIRNGGGYHRADLIMKFLLKRRHLAPTFKSTPYFPGYTEDPLLIKKIPDFFITGHIHYCAVANYKGVTMISGSCWQGKTSFQEKLGHEPEPARVPIVNLKTRQIKILKFN